MPNSDSTQWAFKLRHMEVFRAVMLTGSVSAAAKLLYVSQPAVSKLLQYVEGRLGYRLFQRINNRLVPTAEAHTLYREVERVYQAAQAVNDCARALAEHPGRQLRVCCSASLSTVLIPHALAALKQQWPGLDIQWQTTLISDMPAQLLGKRVDLAVAALPVHHEHLHSQAFMRGRMVAVLPPGHPWASEPNLSLQSLAQAPLVLFRPDMPFGRLLAGHFDRRGLAWRSVLDFTNAGEGVALVRHGLGLSIIDEFVAQDSGLAIVPLAEDISFDISFVYSRFEPLPEAARQMMQVLLAEAQRLGRAIEGFEMPAG
ncbi:MULTISPECIES: LysR family transcriptional regulator [unclassified Pseudomonas]|uniref:LysR family transcriptional regulator n=1 Tax=unclassified Pseudomonas TaxID=196821 RepID=UPI000BCB1E96|nr:MULTISPECIES: LysR substrate-binding domain-containing protein [unclassified Pseudomonas]PVZ16465.1 DNA-binding transcriptional LysR family regulator [Pseudomonas sp. URIL14HWK12:I12]PVZ25679.1 DNA-binding transcriptional LysR family regulator [Pseudomonas sp. URIL14HWK12:I10]PVZ36797.1 DNA-binding transcriptional LysR family regulator [Pseudomonas sp. URIL14HWK12:I11]SNZ12594.1 DNA-binding transcriptional regulator, LysR family [Pseudomonas sp. URIL14HWK12:I9]